MRVWREGWQERLKRRPKVAGLNLPAGRMGPAGYAVLQHSVRLDRPVQAYGRWMARIPEAYCAEVLDESGSLACSVANDPSCLALLKHYHGLMTLAREARKPMFHLKPADGAIGAHPYAAQESGSHFKTLAQAILEPTGASF